MIKRKRIESEEQYQKALEWVGQTAIELEEDPSLKGEQREKKLQIYDRTWHEIRAYNAREHAKLFLYTRSDYEACGLLDPNEIL